MATKDDRPGLLSKVAMFVRNPTKDWSELDQTGENDGSGYDKQALKAMIERKRQNDFVRKREFDQLRRLRNRDPATIASVGRHSFFQTSLPSDMGARADTLKKIDEIEAQMSRQWWKNKGDEAVAQQDAALPASGSGAAQSQDHPSSEMFPSDSDLSAPFPPTEPVEMRPSDGSTLSDEFLPTQMATGMTSLSGSVTAGSLIQGDQAGGVYSNELPFAHEVESLETDPEMEEAAIRFANSDDTGAERTLLEALRNAGTGNPLAPVWTAGLLDFYRATSNPSAFESACYEFGQALGGAKPTWFSLADQPDADGDAEADADAQGESRIWDSPAKLNAQAMEGLRQSMESSSMPWYLGWQALEHISPDAVPLLDALFSSLCEEAVSLRFDGENQLVLALRALTPSGQPDVEQAFWDVRLNALRAMHLEDDFELASLDYCVTFGASPPPWIDARCSVELSSNATGARDGAERDAITRPGALGHAHGMSASKTLALQGELVGDTTQALSALDVAAASGSALVISCRGLVRVDFAAAGSILNWVTLRHAEGKQVQFLDVHRLVAAFFNVIGINERASVVLRPV